MCKNRNFTKNSRLTNQFKFQSSNGKDLGDLVAQLKLYQNSFKYEKPSDMSLV